MKGRKQYFGFIRSDRFLRSKDGKEMLRAYEEWKAGHIAKGGKHVWDNAGEIYTMKMIMEVLLPGESAAAPDTIPASIKQVDWDFVSPDFKDGKLVGYKTAFQRFADAAFGDEYIGDVMALGENTAEELNEIIREFGHDELALRKPRDD